MSGLKREGGHKVGTCFGAASLSDHEKITMLLLLITYYLTGQNVQALPIPAIIHHTPSSCNDLHNCRTIWNIIWSCLATIFSCTWVAVHPNIPSPDATGFVIAFRRARLMGIALIAPELTIIWAMRQWLVAGRLADKYKKNHNWTRVHGFYTLMGGFLLYDGDKAITPLIVELESPSYDFPDIIAEEITDRSKADTLVKGLVILQTGWFIIQCIARGVEHLPITKIELVTVAFALLNLVTYGLWWKKPLNVRRPFRVRKKPGQDCKGGEDVGGSDRVVDESKDAVQVEGGEGERGSSRVDESKVDWRSILMTLSPVVMAGRMAGHVDDNIPDGATRVPTFYAGTTEDERWDAITFGTIIATLFGAIHCIGWTFQFQSPTEHMLWRRSSIAITCTPFLAWLLGQAHILSRDSCVKVPVKYLAIVGGFCIGLFYGIARVALLVLALMSLNSLPAGAYQTVSWTKFIPHI